MEFVNVSLPNQEIQLKFLSKKTGNCKDSVLTLFGGKYWSRLSEEFTGKHWNLIQDIMFNLMEKLTIEDQDDSFLGVIFWHWYYDNYLCNSTRLASWPFNFVRWVTHNSLQIRSQVDIWSFPGWLLCDDRDRILRPTHRFAIQ